MYNLSGLVDAEPEDPEPIEKAVFLGRMLDALYFQGLITRLERFTGLVALRNCLLAMENQNPDQPLQYYSRLISTQEEHSQLPPHQSGLD